MTSCVEAKNIGSDLSLRSFLCSAMRYSKEKDAVGKHPSKSVGAVSMVCQRQGAFDNDTAEAMSDEYDGTGHGITLPCGKQITSARVY